MHRKRIDAKKKHATAVMLLIDLKIIRAGWLAVLHLGCALILSRMHLSLTPPAACRAWWQQEQQEVAGSRLSACYWPGNLALGSDVCTHS